VVAVLVVTPTPPSITSDGTQPWSEGEVSTLLTKRSPATPVGSGELIDAAGGDDSPTPRLRMTRKRNVSWCKAVHDGLKARVRPMRGLKTARSASVVNCGRASTSTLQRGHYELDVEVSLTLTSDDAAVPTREQCASEVVLKAADLPIVARKYLLADVAVVEWGSITSRETVPGARRKPGGLWGVGSNVTAPSPQVPREGVT
jgi:hypothetical protein